MKACVIGATGFVGERLVNKLFNRGFQVRVLTRSTEKTFPSGVEVINVDLISASLNAIRILSDIDFIFNCAGEIKDPKLMRFIHVDAIKNLIQAAQKETLLTGQQFHWIQLSSIGVYKKPVKVGDFCKIDETSEKNPSDIYESSKLESDKVLMESESNFFSYSILRPSAIVGQGMKNKSFLQLLSAIRNNFFFYISTVDSICNYIHVDDVVDALILCAENNKAKNQIFNLSNDCKLSDIVQKISRSRGKTANFLCIPEKPLRFFVMLFSKIVNLPLNKSRIDVLVSKKTYSNKKIQHLLGYIPNKNIPDFSVEYLNILDTDD